MKKLFFVFVATFAFILNEGLAQRTFNNSSTSKLIGKTAAGENIFIGPPPTPTSSPCYKYQNDEKVRCDCPKDYMPKPNVPPNTPTPTYNQPYTPTSNYTPTYNPTYQQDLDAKKKEEARNNAINNSKVVLYSDSDYRGGNKTFSLSGSESISFSSMGEFGLRNDDISSINIGSGLKVTLYWDTNYNGKSISFTKDVSHLSTHGWNDQVSSFKIELQDQYKIKK